MKAIVIEQIRNALNLPWKLIRIISDQQFFRETEGERLSATWIEFTCSNIEAALVWRCRCGCAQCRHEIIPIWIYVIVATARHGQRQLPGKRNFILFYDCTIAFAHSRTLNVDRWPLRCVGNNSECNSLTNGWMNEWWWAMVAKRRGEEWTSRAKDTISFNFFSTLNIK